MSVRRRTIGSRDQGPSAFSAVLARLADTVNAVAVALVDGEGETVDYAGSLEPFDVKVMAAECSIVLRAVRTSSFPGFPSCSTIMIRALHSSFAINSLGDGYALVLRLSPRAFRVSERALCEAIRELCAEAGLTLPSRFRNERWVRVDVREQKGRRPLALWHEGVWCDLEVLGLYKSREFLERERGFRARLSTGAELNLVRERLGLWFAEDLVL